MALSLSDYFIAERGGALYRLTGQDLVDLISQNLGTSNHQVDDVAARDALGDLSLGDIVLVDDASADPTVDSGWAIYRKLPAGFVKTAEENSLDIVITTTNLSIGSKTSNSITIANSDGTPVTLTVASNTEAGLISAAQNELLGYITLTGAIDLDAIKNKSHDAVTTSGTSATNPINVNATQVLTLSISQLTPLP